MAAKDPMYDEHVFPLLKRRGEIVMSNDLVEQMETLETHLSSQILEAVATLKASSATRRASKVKDKGGAAEEN